MTKAWNETKISSLSNVRVLITGGNSGLGFEVAKMLASAGAELILACRNSAKAEQAIQIIQAEIPSAVLSYVTLDLSSLASIRRCADELIDGYDCLDLLVNNAGIFAGPFQQTEDGFELQFGTNHLGHFALTGLLLPLLANSRRPRVVTVSSMAHIFAQLNIRAMEASSISKCHIPRWCYYRSKLANLLFSYELGRQAESHKLSLQSIAVHPGIARTHLFYQNQTLSKKPWHLRFLPMHTAKEGALSIVRACVDETAENGNYYGPSGWLGIRGLPVKSRSSKRSHQLQLARELWDYSEKMTNVFYDWTLFQKGE